MVVPNYNNPLGFIMPESRRRALLTLAQCFDVAVIEDDVYGELA
nr:GntR family transcriptional regulator [Candidatus Pantoea persica]